jgi:hypothetical protein
VKFTYDADPDSQLLRTTANGHLTVKDLKEHALQRFRQGFERYAQILDVREAFLDYSSEEALQLAHFLLELSEGTPPSPTVVVVADDYSFGMARMVSALNGVNYPLHVVRDMEEAERWIGAAAQGSDALQGPNDYPALRRASSPAKSRGAVGTAAVKSPIL